MSEIPVFVTLGSVLNMKKIRSIYIILLSIILLNIFGMTVSAESEELSLIAHSDFESANFENWSTLGGQSEIRINSEKAASGNYYLSATERQKSWSGPCLDITDIVNPNSNITVSAFASGDTEVMISMKYVDSNGTENYKTFAQEICSSDDWTKLEGEFHISDNMVELILYFQTPDGLDDFSIDDVRIYSDVSNIVSERSNENGEYFFDFENGTEGWIPVGEMSLLNTNKFSYTGTHSLQASDRTIYWNCPSVRINAKNGVCYNYSAYVMFNSNDSNDMRRFALKLNYVYNGSDVYSEITSKNLHQGSWSKLSGEFILPDGASDVHLSVQTNLISENGNVDSPDDLISFYVDNVSVKDCSGYKKQKKIATTIIFVVSAILTAVASFIIHILIKRSRASRAIIRSASFDAMTGAYNRNAYEEELKQLEANPEKCRSIFVTTCDVNRLKNINDNYGHENGDKAIKRCASLLLKTIGRRGKVFRTGGDEFICITNEDLTNELITEMTIESGKYKGYPFSAAFGTACHDDELDGKTPDIKAIIAQSDKEMYKNKKSGN